jgi:hypothetical protein
MKNIQATTIQQTFAELNNVPSYVERFADEYEVIPYGFNEDGDLAIHGDTGFCPLHPCPCHEDPELISDVEGHWRDGLLTPDEATAITEGRNI